MYTSRRIISLLFFSLSCVRLLLGSSSFGEDCRGKTVTDPNLQAAGHKYTCEFTDDANTARLNAYCQRTSNTVSSWASASCPSVGKTPLKCHICSCAGTRKDGKCENQAIAPLGGNLGSGTSTSTDAGGINSSGNTIANGIVGGTATGNPSSGTVAPTSGTQTAASCPGGLLNSQGKCCSKDYYDLKLKKQSCCEGILLSTNIPFLGQCIVYKRAGTSGATPSGLVIDEASAFPVLIGGLNRIVVSLILLVSFVGILIAGVMITSAGSGGGASAGKKLIGNIIAALALLGASGVILHLINPHFFG